MSTVIQKSRILFINTYDMIDAKINYKLGLIPGHHLYGVAELMEKGKVHVIIPEHEKFPLLNRLGKWIQIEFLDQQVRALFILHKFDVIYAPYAAANTKLLILLKFLRIIKKPIVILVHDSLFGRPSKNKLKLLIAKKLILAYDGILFLSQKIRSNLIDIYNIDARHVAQHFFKSSWGVDLQYFRRYYKELAPELKGFLMSSGHSARDFDVLVKVGQVINLPIKIYCKPSSYPKSTSIPENVEILSGVFPFERICKDYAEASIILIPLQSNPEGNVGMTSLLDAIAMGKAVIMTKNENIDINLEREKIGITVDNNDVGNWVSAISLLLNDFATLREMGKNSLRLAEQRYNIQVLADDLDEVLEKITEKR